MKKALKKIQAKFIKTTVLYETVIENTAYRVVEKTSVLPWYADRRAICFKSPNEPEKVYIHSMIYHSKRKRYQPVFYAPQKISECWHNVFKPNNALILGVGGGAVPRFFALNFPEMKITGVEYCEEFIEIAYKYFFISEISDRFSLIHGDAYDYIINNKNDEKQDIVFVDIFNAASIPCETFSEEFVNGLYENTSSDSLVIFNLLTLNKDDAVSFAKGIKAPFNKKILIFNNATVTLALIKTADIEKMSAFNKEIHIFDDVVEI